jgi:hypothetical protein
MKILREFTEDSSCAIGVLNPVDLQNNFNTIVAPLLDLSCSTQPQRTSQCIPVPSSQPGSVPAQAQIQHEDAFSGDPDVLPKDPTLQQGLTGPGSANTDWIYDLVL